MELEKLRQDIGDLLENIFSHSNYCQEKEHVSSLDVGHFLKKVNQLQKKLVVLNYLMENKEQLTGQTVSSECQSTTNIAAEEPVISEKETTENINPIKLKPQNITKLSDGLTLNDRYLFANELFKKDMNAFNTLVQSIDDCASYDEAISIISAMNWELDNEHAIAFTNLVERRFS